MILMYILIRILKSGSHLPKKCFYLLQSKLFKNGEERMLFILSYKFFSFLRYLNARPVFFSHVRKGLDKKTKVNSKSCDLTTWEQAITIHVIHNISRRKGNQTMKFGQFK